MTKISFALSIITALIVSSCSTQQKSYKATDNEVAQTENINQQASDRAQSLTKGWPDSSMRAAKEMISKYGEPAETTSDSLIWRNIAPFKRIIVHKTVYNHSFPLLHQNALEHVVDYKTPENKVQEIWKYNGSIVLDRTKGEMASFAENEAMNILALNLADDIVRGRTHFSTARITYGKETLKFLNGESSADLEVLKFGTQIQTADKGQTITNKIRWIGDSTKKPASLNTRQAQEEKKEKH